MVFLIFFERVASGRGERSEASCRLKVWSLTTVVGIEVADFQPMADLMG